MKKVLIITYYWPPAGGISVLRCLKFAKYLRRFGWEPVVFTVKDASYQFYDYNNENDIPEGLQVLKCPTADPISFFKKISGRKKKDPLLNIVQSSARKRTFIDTLGIWIRGNFFIPDARALWIKPAVRYLKKYLKENSVDAILTDGPPHTNTVIGLTLSKDLGIPWLADFQDPWTQVDYYDKMLIGRRADKKHRQLEQEVFKTASKITIASPTWKRDLEKIGARNVEVIYYGYDETDFSSFSRRESSVFKMFHAGLLGNDRNPKNLFVAVTELLKEDPSLKQKLKLTFAGEVDHEIVQAIEKNDLRENAEFLGMLSRKEVFQHYAEASLLLLPINQAKNAAGRIPGKLYEYMRTNVPILVVGPERGDVKDIVERKKLGVSFTYENREGLKIYLRKMILDFFSKKIEDLPRDIEEFSNLNQTRQLAAYLDEIADTNN